MFYRGFVKEFTISRINTEHGTFRFSGLWEPENVEVSNLEVNSIEIMGTDGWVLLNQSSDKTVNLITILIPMLQAQLKLKNTCK